jgi:colicin import membrane protein
MAMSTALTELETALAVAYGDLPSPTRLRNSEYVALRLSGTGVAYRASLKEYVFRDPALWLTDEMRRRFIGVPVVVEHPPSGVMTSRDFGDTAVGIVVHAFVRDEELWGVARIVDAAAAKLIAADLFDTSPSVVFDGDAGAFVDLPGGSRRLLVEAVPAFIDHVALIYVGEGNRGVWTRSDGENGPGVEITSEVEPIKDEEPAREKEIAS